LRGIYVDDPLGADRPVVLEVKADPEAPTLPPPSA
jgi:hypothetical protein